MSEMEISLRGTLQKAEDMPYGTHTIDNYGELFALTSDSVDLDEYVGQEVTVVGDEVEGYHDPRLVKVDAADVR